MSSLDLDMKLVFPGKKGSQDLNGPPFGNDPPNLGKVFKMTITKISFAIWFAIDKYCVSP